MCNTIFISVKLFFPRLKRFSKPAKAGPTHSEKMNVPDAFINAAAVWFILKAVEVVPFAIFDLFAVVKEYLSSTGDKLKHPFDKLKHRFDWNRGKLEFISSGTGFLQFSSCRRSKRLFLVASLVPVLIFVLEIFSIFLGSERRTCQTSRDPGVVKAPSLQLFGEGEREVGVLELNDRFTTGGLYFRPCLHTQSTYSGVEYVVNMCTDMLALKTVNTIVSLHHPDIAALRVLVLKTGVSGTKDFLMHVYAQPPYDSNQNATMVGILRISCEVFVNGKSTLVSNAVGDFDINETVTAEIRNDVRVLEKANNNTLSAFTEVSPGFMFQWADPDDFFFGARNLVLAILSQSRRVGLRTAAEMSSLNVDPGLQEVDILCEEDYFLPRTVSIVVIATAVMLRLLLLALPTSLSSAEYALLFSEHREEITSSTSSTENQPEIA